MLFRIKSYLEFLLKSTNQHGVHSPFVYNLITKCFYKKKKKASYALLKMLYKDSTTKSISFRNTMLLNHLVSYLDVKNALVIDPHSNYINQILTINNTVSISTTSNKPELFDLVYLNINNQQSHNLELLDSLFTKCHNDTVFIISSISNSAKNQSYWKHIKTHPVVTVSINTFKLGFIFIRNEQEIEHFTIRS